MRDTGGARPIAMVTGASAGIGLETARGLAERGYHVVIVGRNPERTEGAVREISAAVGTDAIESLRADFSSLEQVRSLAEAFHERHESLDVLVNNAGLWHQDRQLSQDGFEDTFAVNHLAPFLLTDLLLPALREPEAARVVNVSSRLHEKQKRFDFDDVMCERRRFKGLEVYAQSKLANVLFSNELARRLAGTGITSNSLHPGDVATTITRDNWLLNIGIKIAAPFLKSPSQGAATSLRVATDPVLAKVTGRYFRDEKHAPAGKAALDQAAARRLWDLSVDLVGGISDAQT